MYRISLKVLFAILLLFLIDWVTSPPARSDWINLTGAETAPNIAEIYVLDDHVKVVLEVYIGDLETFDDLVPDDWIKDDKVQRSTLEKRLQHFSTQVFQFVPETGKPLPVRMKVIEPRQRIDRKSPFAGMINPMTRRRVPEPPKDKRVLYAELVYPFTKKPQTLTMVPPLDEEGRALASIGFIAYHKAVPIIDFRYLGQPAHLALDWKDPWYSKFKNPNLKRHHKSALMSFLYVEPYEVRHEILTRVKDLEEWMDLGLRGNEFIEVEELEPLKERIGDFLIQKNIVKVDGQALRPILDRMNYVKVGITGIQLLEQPERMEISTAIVGVIFTYLTDGMPKKVTVDWELFTDQIQQVPATSIDPAGPFPSFVSPDDPVLTWNNYLKNYSIPTVYRVSVSDTVPPLQIPIWTLLCFAGVIPLGWIIRGRVKQSQPFKWLAGVAIMMMIGGVLLIPFAQLSIAKPASMVTTLTDEEATAILHSLLKNVYRAFDFRQEEDVYDKLSVSVEGDLLTEIYLQNRKSFAVKKAGGAQAKVKQVEMISVSQDSQAGNAAGFPLRGTWTAMGTVGHWGHVHIRKNQYDAIVTVQPVEGHWKITGLEMLEEKRIEPGSQLSSSSQEKQ